MHNFYFILLVSSTLGMCDRLNSYVMTDQTPSGDSYTQELL